MFFTKKNTCFILSSDNVQNINIRGYLLSALEGIFKEVYFVGDRTNTCNSLEIPWKGAFRRNGIFFEPVIFLRLVFVIFRYKPSHIISFSPKVNIYAGIISRIFSIKHIAVVSGLGRDHKNFQNKYSIYRILFKLALKKMTGIVAMNQSNYNFLSQLLEPQHILSIPSESYDHKIDIEFCKNYANKDIFYISRIVPEKGILLLLEVFSDIHAKYPSVNMHIAGQLSLGEGSKEEKIFKKYIEGPNIHYYGMINKEKKDKFFKESSIFAFPSNYGEGLPMVLLEAQANRCLTITTNIPGCSDAIYPAMKDFLCDYNKRGLYNSIESAINMPIIEAEKLCKDAELWVVENHNPNKVKELYLSFFESSGFLE